MGQHMVASHGNSGACQGAITHEWPPTSKGLIATSTAAKQLFSSLQRVQERQQEQLKALQ